MLDTLIGLFMSFGLTMMYMPMRTRISYRDRMRMLAYTLRLYELKESSGEFKPQKVNLEDMSLDELRRLEKECIGLGLSEAASVHSYREFKVKEKLSLREDRKRIRKKVRGALDETSLDLSLVEVDKIAAKLGMRPSVGVLVG